MRDALFFAVYLGLAALGLWSVRNYLPGDPFGSISYPYRLSTPTEAPNKAVPPAKPEPSRSKRSGHSSGDFSGSRDAASIVNVPVPHLPFPQPNDLPAGSSGGQIRESFGEPTARVTEVRDGELLEKYYYVNKDRTRVTVVILKDGIVISAEQKRM